MSIRDLTFGLLLFWALSQLGCAHPDNSASASASGLSATADSVDVLVIGDSVSLGWYPKLQDLHPELNIMHNPDNAMNSRNGAAQVSTWVAERPYWAAIVFNHGLWDVTPITSGDNAWFFWTDRAEYENNLRIEADEILKHTNCAIYLLTTEVPVNTSMNAEVVARNAIATQVMHEKGIRVLDLYSVSLVAEHLDPSNIHYSSVGYEQLSEFINGNIGCSL